MVLASVIAISFIGLTKLEDIQKNWLKKTFSVRRIIVWQALHWLKKNNRYYRDIDMDDNMFESRIQALPEDDIPVEILANIREEDRSIGADIEDDTYNPEREEEAQGTNMSSVVPIRTIGVEDMDLTGASNHEILMYALANLGDEHKEGGYTVRHGCEPVNDFGRPRDGERRDPETKNPMAAAFVTLFPFGEGGIEDERDVEVTFKEHARWTLRYSDRRFRLHPSWIFVMFGTIQKREALLSAKLQMEHKDFLAAMHSLARLNVDDLKTAAQQQANDERISNAAVKTLLKQIRAMSARVIGSNTYRVSLRNNIWGTTFYLAPPSVWFTITPNDLHDPVLQVFAGEEIDMDRFVSTTGPDRMQRARNAAQDPYAAAKFFQYIMLSLLRCLFRVERTRGSGVNITSQGGRFLARQSGYRTTGSMGILGEIQAYFAPIETQGKSTLHSHFIIWLSNAPNAEEMHRLLEDGMFRARIVDYLTCTMRAHLADLTPERIEDIERVPECAYSRPPNPDSNTYAADAIAMEKTVVQTVQLHRCSTDTCLREDRNGGLKCKRRAPFPLADATYVNHKGEWGTERKHPFINGWNPTIARTMRCNHDIKLLTNGGDTKDLAYYCVNYAAKTQERSYNLTTLLVKNMSYHFDSEDYINDIKQRGRLMLYRCFNVLNREQEKAASLCVMYIMGWGDVWQSHNYAQIYWTSIAAEIHRAFPDVDIRNGAEEMTAIHSTYLVDEDANEANAVIEVCATYSEELQLTQKHKEL
ncbi:hypothetical protein CALVIDRAFT_530540 [Calocera viscosa TUFC12733]|uniref:Uncharacterized protein n=1 Tax=Calocera viscosa (strain TUFC12733) TaxID=1330018 RepID=A0A167HPA1_CALVF|nr:hypothetical protein CALVIDRAFT_530540 [Calocera viscosa TUFC12733]